MFQDERLEDLGRQVARRDHEMLRPTDPDNRRWWAPAFREAYDDEREQLGYCSDEHDWQPSRVTRETDPTIRRRRALGAWIEICSRCGCFRDRDR